VALLKPVAKALCFVSLGHLRHRFKKFLAIMKRGSIKKLGEEKNGIFIK
jgi:hypothetical protein